MDNFNWRFYLTHYKDLTRPILVNNKSSTFKHWTRYGKFENKFFFKYEEKAGTELWNFDWRKYMDSYPDLLIKIPYSKKSAYDHFFNHGIKEKRFGNIEDYNISINKIKIEDRKKDLISIEFSEGNYVNAINLIYEKYLNRKADKDGMIGYLNRLNKGFDISWIIENIKKSDEYTAIKELNELIKIKEIKYKYDFPKKINIIKKRNDIDNSFFINSWKININFEINVIEFNNFDDYIKNNAPEFLKRYEYLKSLNDENRLYDFFVYVYMFKEGGIFCENNTICLQEFDFLLHKHSNKEIIVGLGLSFNSLDEANNNNINYIKMITRTNFICMPNVEIIKKLIDFTYDNDYNDIKDFIKDSKTVSEYIFNTIIYKNIGDKKIQFCDVNVFGSGLWNKSKISVRNNLNAYSCYYNPVNKPSNEKNLDILILMKDNEKYLKKYFPVIRKCLSDIYNLKWFIYENGSSDETKKLINYYFNDNENNEFNYLNEHHNLNLNSKDNSKISLNEGEVSSENFNQENLSYIRILEELKRKPFIGKRCEKLAIARENLLELTNYENDFNSLNDDWCLLIDTDIVFDYENTLKPIFEAKEKYKDGVMFCSNCHSYAKYNENEIKNFSEYNLKYGKILLNYYYDTFAFDYGEYIWSPNINKILEKKFNGKDVYSALTAFGGVVLIKKSVLALSGWSTKCNNAKKYKGFKIYGMSEHYSFCESVRKYGNIYIVRDSIANWMEDDGYKESKDKIPKSNDIIKKSIIIKNLLKNYLNYKKL